MLEVIQLLGREGGLELFHGLTHGGGVAFQQLLHIGFVRLDVLRLDDLLHHQLGAHVVFSLAAVHIPHLRFALAQDLHVLLHGEALLLHPPVHLLHHFIQFFFHHGSRHVDLGVGDGLFHHGALGGFVRLNVGGFLQGLFNALAVFLHGVEIADFGGEIVVQLRQLLAGDGVELHMEDRVLALEVFRMIGFGELDVQVPLLADLHAHHLLLEAGDEGVGANDQRLMLGGAAVELHAVHSAGVIQLRLVAVLQPPVGHVHHPGNALLLLLNAGIHLRVGHLADGAGHVQLLVLAQLDFRHHVHFAAELQILAGFHGLHIHLGTGHGLEVVFFHGLIVGFGEQDIQSVLIKNALAEHILNQLAGRLALAEAGNVDLSAQLQIRLLQRVFKLRRGCLEADLYFVAAELFYRMFHVFSSLGAGFPLPHLSKYTI